MKPMNRQNLPEIEYLESLIPSKACEYLMLIYKDEILDTRDFYYKLKDYEINIYDAMEDVDNSEWVGTCYNVDVDGWTDWDYVIYRHYFNNDEVTA